MKKTFVNSMRKMLALLGLAALLGGMTACGTSDTSTASTPPASAPVQDSTSSPSEEQSEAWEPNATITINVAFAAGGDTDYNARMYAEQLGSILGTSVIVNNVTGSGGAVCSEEVKNAEADGYTVMFTQSSFVLNQVAGITDYGIEAFELSNIAGASSGWAIVAPASLGVETLEELVERSKSESITFGGTAGAAGSLIGVELNAAGGNFNVVDYGSATDKVAGMLSGDLGCSVIPILTANPYIESGDFICLGICEETRNECFPDIPTVKEQGYDVICPSYYFFAFPKGTPENVIKTFTDACEQIYESEAYQSKLGEYSQMPMFQRDEEALKTLEDFKASAESFAGQF